jgi:hypothetical protein
MKKLNLFFFAVQCVYIFAASLSFTELIFWHFGENKIGTTSTWHIIILATALHAVRAFGMIMEKAFDFDFTLKTSAIAVFATGAVFAQFLLLNFEGVQISVIPFQFATAWILANGLSIFIGSYYSAKTLKA